MNIYFYLAFIPLHLFGLYAAVNYTHINWWLVTIFWILLSGYGVGVTLHRLLSHRAFETWATMKNLLSLISCYCIQGSPIFWVTVHRGYHHKHSDTAQDIHSPIHGKWWAYFLWTIRINAHHLNYKFVPDLLRSKFQMTINKYYFAIIWLGWILSAFNMTVFCSLVAAQLITMHLEFCVNLFCHHGNWGYRNYETKDNSRNYWLFGLLCWGIGYHNNHHHNPRSISFASKWWEWDPTTVLVRTVRKNDSC
jgi:stearoyl-CoA desaturase (delta-9 desaturase)